jgi:hypothetical protein
LSLAAEQLTLLNKPEESLGRLERRNRMLGQLAIGPETRLLNNDALADVFLLMEAVDLGGSFADVEEQIDKNYHTDMSERSDGKDESGNKESQEKHFDFSIDYKVEGNDLFAGKFSFRQIVRDGLEAARSDALEDKDVAYALNRAQVQAKHADMILDWYHSGDPRAVRISSLCPTKDEVPKHVAKKANFKQGRLMASEWIFERTTEGMRMHAFSQDNLTLEDLKEINQKLGISDTVAGSTLSEMDKLVITPYISGVELKDAQRKVLDEILSHKNGGKYHYGIKVSEHDMRSSNEMVSSKPKAQELWKKSIQAMNESFMNGRVSAGLARIVSELRGGYNDSVIPIELGLYESHPISISQGRNFMEYLRKYALPQYIFGNNQLVTGNKSSSYGGNFGSIASAGSHAFSSGISYEGDCPTSNSVSAANSEQGSAKGRMEAALNTYGKKEFKSKWCPNCLPVPKAGKEVKAWRKGDDIGCYDCGRVQSICTGKIIKKGRSPELLNTTNGVFYIAFNALAKHMSEIKKSLAIKRQQKIEQEAAREELAKRENTQTESLKYGHANLYF